MRILPLAIVAALVLTAGACATSPAKKSAGGTAGATARADPGSKSGAGGEETEGKKKPWWRLSQYSRGNHKPLRPGDMPPGSPGLVSGKDGEFVLFRKGEANSSDPSKPTKVKR